MPPRFSKEVLQLRNTFNPKYIAKKKMAPKNAAKPNEISATAKPTVARKKTTAKRGGGRGRGGRSRNPPMSLQLDAEVDIDTDEEDSGSKATKKDEDIRKSSDVAETNEKKDQSSEMKEGELESEKSKEGKECKEKSKSEEKSEGDKEQLKESEEKLEGNKEKESEEKSEGEKEKLDKNEGDSNEKERKEDSDVAVVKKNDDDVLLKDLVSETLEKDERSEIDATVASTVEREIGSNAEKIDVEDRDDATVVFDDGLDPLFSKPASRTRSKRKMLEIFGDDDEDVTPEASPPKPKVTQRKRGSGSKSKAPKRARYQRDLPSIDENEIIEEKVPLNTCMDLVIAPYAESFKNDILNHLNSLDLPEEIFKLCHGMLICCFHSGRRYKKSWYDTSLAFKYFKEAMYAQGWVNLLDKYSPMYLSEIIQFYATVKVDVESGTLSAFIN
ncbi:uncharacterized protein LOC141596422 isoform X1 [Silene latifolia]|uniref:uncharacterized protein LOC141596422 isoform X1 n=1 Tax=Silene latifolia TaxID=37657 RepID=UPI003D781649